MIDLFVYELKCLFDVFFFLVWCIWMEFELVQCWYGFGVILIVYKMDVCEGGEWLYEM